ncbi:MAG: hypothetical protein U9N52_01845 [Campylobacterota bacterium]|nr:hypothetical protein [Campylobacterota bacterium]
MNTLKVRKNFAFDKEIVDQASLILKGQQKSLTEAIGLYFQAIIKEPSILETVEKSANKRTGAFIGTLDGKIGNEEYKDIKKSFHENIS